MKNLITKLFHLPCLDPIRVELSSGSSAVIETLPASAKAFFAAFSHEATQKPLLILTGAGSEEFQLYNNLPFFVNKQVVELPAWETLPSENIAPSPDIVGARYTALKQIASSEKPLIVLTTLQGALQKLLSYKKLEADWLKIARGQKISFDTLINAIFKLGYERKSIVSDKGEFAVRGGIIDIFPITTSEPFRLEFWGDEIDSIRSFDTASQKSHTHYPNLEIGLAQELESMQEDGSSLVTIFDYLGKDTLVVFDDLEALEDRYANLVSLGAASSKQFLGIEEFLDLTAPHQRLFFTKHEIESISSVTVQNKRMKFYSKETQPHEIGFEIFQRHYSAKRWNHPFQTLETYCQEVCGIDDELDPELLLAAIDSIPKKELIYIVQNEQEEATLNKKLEALGLHMPKHIVYGYLSNGFAILGESLILLPLCELTHRFKIRRDKQRSFSHFTATDAFDIKPGEAVVHFNHGIGKYLGIEKKPNHLGVEQEFFSLAYADNAKIYVPLTQANLISKYIGASAQDPKFHTLGAPKWKRQREQTEKSILGYAAELLKLYAERKMKGGFIFKKDSPETQAFEEEFPYIETDDQLRAIQDIKNDMCSERAMDRLVCGDVGYGKTEVALRAAFKAVLDGRKQVAVLAPTTVLALQHYENFTDRMKSFGVRTALLSRFNKPKEIKRTIEALGRHQIDVVIGTHRLLQKDIQFADLGLLIIDEEQRFGVRAKEHLKKIKTNVDCLTLTATPIPRTLYMSLVGARDLSVIATPPQDRLPVKTVIAEQDDTIIKTALLRELNRDGQAYFLHNRVETIFDVANKLQAMLPKARIAIGHGQMDPEEIDLVFHAFKKGDVDILVATSIIESGLDIPNANTIIIDNAHRFGIADLYQIRGRVGRWNRRAYAYFLLPKRASFSEIAVKRLESIAQAGGYGGGMKVAMCDLEMRGTGDILGIEQSGHVSEIGFHLYCKLLKRTIDSMQGKAPSWTIDTKVEIPFTAKLDDDYVNDVTLRMEIYQRLADARTLEEVEEIWEEVKDRFGKPPEHALALYHLSRIRVFAAQHGFTTIKVDAFTLFYEKKSGHDVTNNKVLIGRISTPQTMEEKVCKLLLSSATPHPKKKG